MNRLLLSHTLKAFTISVILILSGCREQNSLPEVRTIGVSNISSNSAISGGKVLSSESIITTLGVCWNTTGSPTINDYRTIDGSGLPEFTSQVKGLQSGTTYYIRAYAISAEGTAYGNTIVFKTLNALPKLSDIVFLSINENKLQCQASVISDGGTPIASRGFCWSKNPNPTIADSKIALTGSTGTFSAIIENLEINAKYYIRAFTVSNAGVSYSPERTFTTSSSNPVLIDNDHLLLGNPSGAINNIISAENYLMVKPQYALSYSNSKLTANWVAWHLNSSWLGSVSRQDDFRADENLPASWYRVKATDFYYSTYGFDRGHMCPSADRTATVTDNSATFLMTNMVPQAPNNNQIVWENLESYCRDLAKKGSELYIISGPAGEGGASAKGTFTILKSGVVVPKYVWKIALVLPNGNDDISRIMASTRVIAVVIPNNQECSKYPWTNYRVSVDSIENLTGYDFFKNVPKDIQDAIEARVDNL